MTIDSSRVMSSALRSRIMSADDAAALVPHGANVGMSGFTGSGYPKAVPLALAHRIEEAHARGAPFRIGVWTGASTAPELDGALAKVNGIELRLPYQSDPITRERINAGTMEYIDIHLSLSRSSSGSVFSGIWMLHWSRSLPSCQTAVWCPLLPLATTRLGSIRPTASFSRSIRG